MKTQHSWRESVSEKLHFMHGTKFMNTTIQHGIDGRYSARSSHKPVTFFCAAPQAREVAIAGDFNHWRPFPMARSIDGWWLAQIELPHGHHQYHFIVDGRPALDPKATGTVRNEHDECVSLMAVS